MFGLYEATGRFTAPWTDLSFENSAFELHTAPPAAVNTISAVEFSQNGDYLATGDVSGRVSIYKTANAKDQAASRVIDPLTAIYVDLFSNH